jgi:hypothetical protein
MFESVGIQLFVALLLGAAIGLERESSGQTNETLVGGGVRTFALVSLLGALAGLFYINNLPLVFGLMSAAFVILLSSYYVMASWHMKDFGLTTEMSFVLTFLIGISATTGIIPLQLVVAVAVVWDDSVRITINGTEVYVNGSFGRCERGTVFGTTLNQNLKQYLINGRNTIEMLVGVAGMGFGSSDFSINYDVNRKCSFIDNCKNIPSNCSFKSSQCLDTSKKDDSCVYTQNLYSCATTTTTSTAQVDCGSNIYCLNGQCEKSEENSDNDFVKPISYLTALNQAGKDNDGAHDLKIFTGGAKSCEKDSVSYNNCCKDSGWGQDYAGASCSTEEQELAQMQSKKLCHYVGSYCSKKSTFSWWMFENQKIFLLF